MLRRAPRAEGQALMRFFYSLQNQTADTFARFLSRIVGHTKPSFGVVVREFFAKGKSAPGNLSDSAPLARNHAEDLADQSLGGLVAFAPDRTSILVLNFCSTLLQLLDARIEALQNIQRFEPGDNNRYPILLCDRPVFGESHHCAHVPRREKSLYAISWRRKNRFHRGWHQYMGYKQGEVAQPLLVRLKNSHGIGRRGGLESDRKEDDFSRWIVPGDSHRVERGINNSDITGIRFDGEHVRFAPRDAQHVAKGTKDHSGPSCDFDCFIDQLKRRHADRTAGPVDERYLFREQLINAKLHYRVSLPPADLHDCPRTRGYPGDCTGEALGANSIAIFVDVFHNDQPDWSSANSSISRR